MTDRETRESLEPRESDDTPPEVQELLKGTAEVDGVSATGETVGSPPADWQEDHRSLPLSSTGPAEWPEGDTS